MKNILMVIMTLLLAAGSAGCVLHSRADEPLDAMALANRDAGDPADLSADQLERMADSQYAQGDYELAFVNYNRALTLEPDDNTLLVKRGRVLWARDMDEQSLKVFQDVLADHPEHALANESAGVIYFESGLLDEALVYFEKALAEDPDLWRSHTYIGIIHDREGEPHKALKAFEMALADNPGNGEVLNNIGVAKLVMGDNDGAQKAFHQAISQGAADDRTYNNLGMALVRMGRIHEALEAFRYGGDDAAAYNNLGYVLLSQGRAREAIDYFQQAIEQSPAYYEKAFENMKQARVMARNQPTGGGGNVIRPAYGSNVALGRRSGPVLTVTGDAPSARQPNKNAVPEGMAGTEQQAGDGFYSIQISSWREEKNARRHLGELGRAGHKAEISRTEGEKGTWFKVHVGRYATRREADEDRGRVVRALQLHDARVTRVEPANIAEGRDEEASL